MDQCKANDVKFFFKQWAGTNKKKTGRELQGKFYNEMPSIEKLEEVHF
jgi:protein gp37